MPLIIGLGGSQPYSRAEFQENSVDVWIFFIFFCLGRGKGEFEGLEGGGGGGLEFLLKFPKGGGWVSMRGRGRGAGRVSAANWGIGGLNIFFRGQNVHQEKLSQRFRGLSVSSGKSQPYWACGLATAPSRTTPQVSFADSELR